MMKVIVVNDFAYQFQILLPDNLLKGVKSAARSHNAPHFQSVFT